MRREKVPLLSSASFDDELFPPRGGVRLLVTGAHGFQREVGFAMDEEPAVITGRVRATLDE